MGQERPCILISDPTFNPFSDLAKSYYAELKKVGIYHHNAESAATHIAKIYNNVADWWNSDEVIRARDAYCNTFVKTGPETINNYNSALRNIVKI